MAQLLIHTLPDDAFIYFVIARNLAAGRGATFDSLQPTNGFHPLWALRLVPFFGGGLRGDLRVHVALTAGAVCDVAAGVLTAGIVWHWGGGTGMLPSSRGHYTC